jgi:hypothetical protein
MANWQYILDINDAWEKAEEDKITSIDLAKVVVERLIELRPKIYHRFGSDSSYVEQLDSIIINFESFIDDNEDDDSLFNEVFDELYDWADTNVTPGQWPPNKLCWIRTFLI